MLRGGSPIGSIVALMGGIVLLALSPACSKEKPEEPTASVQVVAVKKATIEQTVTSEAILFPLAQSAIVTFAVFTAVGPNWGLSQKTEPPAMPAAPV